MLDLSRYRVSLSKWNDGVWFDVEAYFRDGIVVAVPPDHDGPAICLRARESRQVQEAMLAVEEERNPLRLTVTAEQRTAMTAEVFARGMVTGLRGVAIDGKAVEVADVRRLFDDPELPGMMLGLCALASRAVEHYRKTTEAKRLGN